MLAERTGSIYSQPHPSNAGTKHLVKLETGGPLLEIALQLVRNYHPVFQSFVQDADPEETMLVPIRVSSKAAHWPQSNVTLMGDALHLMSPFGGSGGNTALQDATLLAEKLDDALNKNGSVAQALTSYQNDALKYGLQQVRSGKRMTRLLLSRNAFIRSFLSVASRACCELHLQKERGCNS
jgi:2-polyprenyl-6-methoxyphenol hydroxylase-like FAD-dependent oxidoreductase